MQNPDTERDNIPRFESGRKPTLCPACQADSVATIVYGLLDDEGWAKLRAKGHYVGGGCCISLDSPTWRCTACSAEIHRPFHGS